MVLLGSFKTRVKKESTPALTYSHAKFLLCEGFFFFFPTGLRSLLPALRVGNVAAS